MELLALAQKRALAHVTSLAAGEPADQAMRVTLHFHPDQLVAGAPILEAMARDGVSELPAPPGRRLTAFRLFLPAAG